MGANTIYKNALRDEHGKLTYVLLHKSSSKFAPHNACTQRFLASFILFWF